jgi:MFS family permease
VRAVSASERPASTAPRTCSPGETAFLLLPLFSVALGYGAMLPVLPGFLDRLHGASTDDALPLHAGLLAGVYIGAFAIAAPFWGGITDRHGPRGVLLAGLVGYAAATLWLGVAGSLVAVYALRFAAGAFAAGLVPATTASIVARCDEASRVRHLGWMSAAAIGGFLVGPALTGWVHGLLDASSVARTSPLHVTAVPIWATGGVALASAAGIAWRFRPSQTPFQRVDLVVQSGPAAHPGARLGILLLSALGTFGLGAFEVGLSLQSRWAWRLSPADLGWLFVTCSMVMLAIQVLLFDRLQRQLQPAVLVVGGFVLMTAGFAFMASATAYGVVVVLVAVIALGSGVLLPTLNVAMVEKAGSAVGTAVGYQAAASNLGQAAGSAAIGLLFIVKPNASFTFVAVATFLAAVAAGILARLRGARLSER